MGKKTDFLLGRGFKTSKFKILAKLALSRISILKNQHQSRSSFARSDVIELLTLGHQERALLRVDHVIEEQNKVDVFCMIESYCHQLIDRAKLIRNKDCPDELNEAVSSLLVAAPRCGEFPELRQIRDMFESWFGVEFATEKSNTNMNREMVKKLSTQQPSLDIRMKLLKKIASENGIVLQLEEGEENCKTITGEKEEEEQSDINKQISITEQNMEDSPLAKLTKAIEKYIEEADDGFHYHNTAMEVSPSEDSHDPPPEQSLSLDKTSMIEDRVGRRYTNPLKENESLLVKVSSVVAESDTKLIQVPIMLTPSLHS